MSHAQLRSLMHTAQGVITQCLKSGKGQMVYQIHQHGHVVNAVVMHLSCHVK